jgi:hypothetical protein
VLRNALLCVIAIDLALVIGRLLTSTTILAMPGSLITLGWLAASFAAATCFVIWASSSKSPAGDARLPTAIGLVGGVMLSGHMVLENFGARIGEDWRLTIGVMLSTFALWFGSGWWAGRRYFTSVAGALAGCWAAIVSVTLAISFGFVGMYFDVPRSEYVATWPEYIQSGWSDPQAFAVANTIDAASSHLLTALLLGTILGGAGGFIGSLQMRRATPGRNG